CAREENSGYSFDLW
nr:immunoglobulin heavy chain junction region [Macaca mulatta]MOV39115.1 immunoglobulin heavy chain junction region [Macaca mulatta]MOV39845.1 immunoglobulin heavy chain junction region [Macaca mulatta]MOV39862.1 immunoglobulin heavy chain junction region [Macaca mulatta]MOV39898.1 immunoglobulin heavy chain junction region [Macaca mulatta]